jgi:hypothetical protein
MQNWNYACVLLPRAFVDAGSAERHGCSADDEHVGDHALAYEAMTESGERSFELFPVE